MSSLHGQGSRNANCQARKLKGSNYEDSISSNSEDENITFPIKKLKPRAYITKRIDHQISQEQVEASFVDKKSSEALIRTPLSSNEYENLKRSDGKKTEFLLTDLDRDPQTWVKNPKAIKKFKIIQN